MARRFQFGKKKQIHTIEETKPQKLRGNKPITRYEMILEWFNEDKKFVYQRLGFKTDGNGFSEAMDRANKLAALLSNVGKKRPDLDKGEHCRVIAVYAATAFKDWTDEVKLVVRSDNHEAVRKILERKKEIIPPKKKAKPISFVKVR